MIEKYKLLKNKTVLYVEDDLSLQKNIVEILSNFFDKLLVASDGDEAYDIYLENQNKIDIMITDINMPNTDGITLCKSIREYNKTLPIVIVSAYTNTDYLLDSIDLNIVTYVTKPLTTKKVLSLLDKFLEYFNLNNHIVINNSLEFDYASGSLKIDNSTIQLTKKETKFFKLLSENSIVTYDMMYEYMWDYDKAPSQDAVKSFIRKLQKKLPDSLCQNKKGVGYYLSI
ncbi:response regulator transcription factor [Sulfurovum sp. bin170]|uniref:response regulator transcription factor n=1 Tax=Sulfurovum sp. bin170 TaxID=2695268 RepID=UPI0013E0BEA1|nr:response regulator transcription factor [Sulfurovum sp. bin170]NEW61258.1 response regulator transcription factor [Sulfurovum sp. bin170]